VSELPKVCPRCGEQYEASVAFCAKDGTRLIAGGSRDLVGSVIAERYRVTARLGEGGMGQVWLAEHVRMKRKSAIKVLRPALVGDLDALQRFTREAENASQISHPNVAQIYDFGETADGLVYLAMEFIDGEPLAAKLKREFALHPDVAADVIGQAADALGAAHAQGILHRDLKPDNIMLSRRGDGTFHVKLVDFGIARTMDPGESRVTRTGFAVGTPEYMSPEQIAGETLDARSDLYSLALVAFMTLTGKDAFPNAGSKESLIARLTSRPQTLQSAKDDVSWPEALQDVFDRALAPEPNERFVSVELFAAELGNAISAMTPSQTAALYRRALEARIMSVAAKTPHGGDVAIATPATPQHATPLPPESERRRVRAPSGEGPAIRPTGAASGAFPPVAAPSGEGAAYTGSASTQRATVTVTDEAIATDAPSGARPNRTPLIAGGALVALALVAVLVMRGGKDDAGTVTTDGGAPSARTDSVVTPSVAAAPPPAESATVAPVAAPTTDRKKTDTLAIAASGKTAPVARGTRTADSVRATPAAPPPSVAPSGGLPSTFPEDAIRSAFAGAAPDYRAHTARAGNVRALLMTPTVLAWRARQGSAWKRSNPRADLGIPYDVVDPIEAWVGWQRTLTGRRPVVVIEVAPVDVAFPRFAPEDAPDLTKGDVSSVQLLRNGTPVAASDMDRIPAVVNEDGVTQAGKTVANQVVFAVPADAFGGDGGAAGSLELSVTTNGKRTRIKLDNGLVRRIADEFAPWREAKK
jgi:serine/threonine-protein kinase